MRVAAGAADSASALPGDLERAPPFAPALRKGEAVRLIPGVLVLDGGLLGRLIAGLSHEEKKSSPGSPAGVPESTSAPPVPSVTKTSLGNLMPRQLVASQQIWLYALAGISRCPPFQFVFVLCSGIRGIACLCVFAGKCGSATVRLKILGGRLVSTNFHCPQLIP